MPTTSWRGRFLVAAAVSLASLGWCWIGPGFGDPQQGGAAGAGQTAGPTKLYFGVAACVDCHSKGTNIPDAVCSCKEVQIWEKEDKHKNAYTVLMGDRAKRMGELLKINPSQDASCLS